MRTLMNGLDAMNAQRITKGSALCHIYLW